MSQSVKKRSASHIYYGVDRKTGELRHIDSVPSGLNCECDCAACGKQLMARKGDERRHHFAHVSNYECMYASEVAIYKAVSEELGKSLCLLLPPVTLRFPSWTEAEVVRGEQTVTLEQVSYSCAPLQYPPELYLSVRGSKLRLLLEFGKYYSEDDLAVFSAEAEKGGYSTILVHLPGIEKEAEFTPGKIRDILLSRSGDKKWVRSALADHMRNLMLEKAVIPEEWERGFLCEAHKDRYKGKYSARYVDCAHCRFNLAKAPSCLCTAKSGVQSLADLKADREELSAKMDQIRSDNEAYIERRELAERSFSQRNRVVAANTLRPDSNQVGTTVSQAALADEAKRIAAAFDPDSPEQTLDRFGRRWLKCVECGQIKEASDMSDYGGRVMGPNRGICRECSRNGNKLT